jgi:hypothetical protein
MQVIDTSTVRYVLTPEGLLRIVFPGTPEFTVEFDTASVDVMIANLGSNRIRMTPPVQAKVELGQQVISVTEPQCNVSIPPARLLQIRDPRYGWLFYKLSRELAESLGTLLLSQSELRKQNKAN